MKPGGPDAALVAELVRQEAERGERLVALMRAAMFTALTVVGSIIMLVIEPPAAWRPLAGVLPFLAVPMSAATWLYAWYVRRRPYRRSLGVISVTADVVALSAVVAATTLLLGSAGATSNLAGATPALLGLFFVVGAAGMRQDPGLCVLSGVLAWLCYGTAVVLSYARADLSLVDPAIGFFARPLVWLGRGAVLAFVAGMAALAARNARRMAERTGAAVAERAALFQVFGRYVDPEIARSALERDGGAEVCEVTVLFTDLREFTRLSERLSPADTLALLNEHYQAIVPEVHANGGTVNKFIGDAIMATFGAPMRHADHAARAVRAARGMLAASAALNARLRAGGRPELPMGIGIATGSVVVGSLGAADRIEYAVIGDTVNTAARLEGMNKELGTEVVLSAATHDALAGAVATRALGEVSLRGKTQLVAVYTI